MGRRSLNPRRIKIHRTYAVEEIARVLRVHKNTVRNWLNRGLEAIDDCRPTLILGWKLRQFLEARRAKARQTCPAGHLFCVRCRAPKVPALQMADYIAFNTATGNLQGICPDCGTFINRRVAFAKVNAIRGNLDIKLPQAHSRLGETTSPSPNCDLEGGTRPDEKVQP